MLSPAFAEIVGRSIHHVRLVEQRTGKRTEGGPELLVEHIRDGGRRTRLTKGILDGNLTRLALYFSRLYRDKECAVLLSADGGILETGAIYDHALLNLALLARVHLETGQCEAFAKKMAELYLLEPPERFAVVRSSKMFSSEEEMRMLEEAHRIVHGPAKTLDHDIIVAYSVMDEGKLERIKINLDKDMLRIVDLSRDDYIFARCVDLGNGERYWATEVNLTVWFPYEILAKSMKLLELLVPIAHPVAMVEHHGRVFFITEEVKDSVILLKALRDLSIPERTKDRMLFLAGRFLRETEEKGVSITDPNPTNLMIRTDGSMEFTLIDIAEVAIKEGRGETNLNMLLRFLSDPEKGCVMQGYRQAIR